MRCVICGKKASFLKKGCCSPKCAWEFLSKNPKKYEDRQLTDDEIKRYGPLKINHYAAKIRSKLPKSEVWFWEKFKKSGLHDPDDRSNESFLGTYIPDIQNATFKYIIEIDGDAHKSKEQWLKDHKKDNFYRENGYAVFRVKAFDEHSFCDFSIKMKLFHKRRLGLEENLTPQEYLDPKHLLKKKVIVRKKQLITCGVEQENSMHGKTDQGRNPKEI